MMTAFWDNLRNNPVLISELRARMRGRRTFILLGLYLLVLSGLLFSIYTTIYQDTQIQSYYIGSFQRMLEASSNLGKAVFYGTNILLLLGVTFVSPAYTANAIVGEKERQTYDLLAVTALSARDIVLGKLNAIMVFMGLLIFATLPFQTMAFVFGGVAIGDIVLSTVLLLLSTLLYSCFGLFVSSFARSTTAANMISYAIIVPLLLGVPFFLFLVGVAGASATFAWLEHPPFLIALVLVYGILFFVSINPVSMAVASAIFVQETGNYFFSVESFLNNRIPLPAPWLVFVVFSLLASYILIKATISRVARVPRM